MRTHRTAALLAGLAAAGLVGVGVAGPALADTATASLTPSSHTFGPVFIDETTFWVFDFTNTGDVNLSGVTVSLAATTPQLLDGGFSIVTNTCTGELAPATSCAITVSFRGGRPFPSSNPKNKPGRQTGTLYVRSTAANSPATAALVGLSVCNPDTCQP
jgi:hypothetical protein